MSTNEQEMKKLVVGLAIQIVLDTDSMVKQVMEACEKYGIEPEFWAEVVTDESGELRGNCYNQRPVPPFEIRDEDGEFVAGPLWDMEDVQAEADFNFGLHPHWSYVEIQNFAGNTCESVQNADYDDEEDYETD